MWANNMKKPSTLLRVKNSQGTKTAFRLHLGAAAGAPWGAPCRVAGATANPVRTRAPGGSTGNAAQTQGGRGQHTAWRPPAGECAVHTEALGSQPPALNGSLGVKADNSKTT